MKNKLMLTALSSIFVLTAACQDDQTKESGEKSAQAAPAANSAAMGESEEFVVATVNGKPISVQSLNFLQAEVAQRSGGTNIPREQMIEELINRELLSQEADSKDLANRQDIAQQIAAMERAVLSQAAAEEFLSQDSVSDDELKVEYDARVGDVSKVEYKARHILAKTKEEAVEIIQKLDDGGDFAELAQEFSIGPTGKNGGDLGWFSPDQMVGPFSDAVSKLEDGKYTAEPIMTQFGWHVILREEKREKNPPPFEAVKAQLVPLVKRQHFQKHIADLRKSADVKITPLPADENSETSEEQASEESHEHAAHE